MSKQTTRSPSARVAEFVAALEFDGIDEELVRLAERCFVDTTGVLISGTEEPASRHARTLAAAEHDGGSATVVGAETRAPATAAVLANGTAAHAQDYDDVSWGMDGHPSAPLVVPILSVGEVEDVTGKAALTAYVAGYETMCYLAAPIRPDHYERGWHATATFGTLGAAVATASLLDLSATETREALNIAASMPAGLKKNFGSMTKPLHVGLAARSGVTAAKLAADGHTADPSALGTDGGFLDLYSGESTPDLSAVPNLGTEWALAEEGIHVKKYPCCYFTHTSIAATIDLVSEHGIDPAAIQSIDVTASQGAVDALAHDDPETPTQAKFSMPYTVSHAALRGDVGLSAFEEPSLSDDDVRQLAERVSLTPDEQLPYSSHTATVRIKTPDSVVDRTIENPPGTHERPLSDAELHEKFRDCAARVYSDTQVETVLTQLDDLREEASVASIAESL